MSKPGLTRPLPTEYPPYYGSYVAEVPPGDILPILRGQIGGSLSLLRQLSEADALRRYAPEKWSVKEVVGHVIDAERVFAYRALAFARGDRTALPSFDEQVFVAHGGFDQRSLSSLAEEWEHLRASNLALFESLPTEAWDRCGVANGREFSTRAMPWVIAGHELHHLRVLRQRYL